MDLLRLFCYLIAAIVLYTISLYIYNAYFHPLHLYPGPKLWAASTLPKTFHNLRGVLPFAIKDLHDTYGDVVRIGPDELSYISGQAWEDIYGHVNRTKTKNYEKDITRRAETLEGVQHIIMAKDEDHRRMRKLQAHAFSEKALSAQEDILQSTASSFIRMLNSQFGESESTVVDLCQWYNWATFDVIGDLAFGESFHCVERAELDPHIEAILFAIKISTYVREARQYPVFKHLLQMPTWVFPESVKQKFLESSRRSAARVEARMKRETDRPDFLSYMMKYNDTEKGMSDAELKLNSSILLIAGSETTATLLSGTTYHLVNNPEILHKLTEEIRGAFKSEEDITIRALAEQKYLIACFDEGLRMFPPVALSLPRIVPMGGDIVCGQFVPEETRVGVSQWSANHCSRNWNSPSRFVPERWLGDPLFDNDKQKARQPFSYGPRNCIGKNLAYAEMRLLLARILWSFDLEITEESKTWEERNKVYTLWMKAPLTVTLRRRML